MTKKIVIAFDLDGVLADKPPFIPKKLLEWLFKGSKTDSLHYRFPHHKLEQLIRKVSHYYLFRPAVKENVSFIKKIAKDGKYELYIISGRYSFLQKETEKWLKKRGLGSIFKKVFINLKDEQPHFFKEEVLNQLKPDIFIDDDPALVNFLLKKVQVKIFCFDGAKSGSYLHHIIQ